MLLDVLQEVGSQILNKLVRLKEYYILFLELYHVRHLRRASVVLCLTQMFPNWLEHGTRFK